MAWRLAGSLVQLRDQVNSAYPERNKASDGTIGDAAHSSRTSQHNPNPAGVVTAIDITHDLSHGVDGQVLADSMIADPRAWYVIFNRRIRYTGGNWQAYSGTNPHTAHVHLSTKQDPGNYDNASPWAIGDDMITKDDLAPVRIVMSEVEGWNGHEIHAGKHDGKIMGAWQGKKWTDFLWHAWNVQKVKRHDLTATVSSLQQQLTDVQTALANEQNKPPKEVIKEVQVIVEKIVEVPVDEKQVVEGFFKRIWNSLFKKG